MSDRPIDAEKLAALLDGRLSDVERAALLEELASTGDRSLGLLADAAEARRAMESDLESPELASAGSRPPLASTPVRGNGGRVSRRPTVWALPLLAAATLVVFFVPRSHAPVSPTGDGPSDVLAYEARVTRRPVFSSATAPSWNERRGADELLDATSRAVRIGVGLSDLALAARVHDASVRAHADEVGRLLAGMPGGAALARAVREAGAALAAGDTLASDQLRALARDAAVAAGDSDVALGAWVGAVRRAVQTDDAAALERLKLAPAPSAAARARAGATLDSLRAELGPSGTAAGRAAILDRVIGTLAP